MRRSQLCCRLSRRFQRPASASVDPYWGRRVIMRLNLRPVRSPQKMSHWALVVLNFSYCNKTSRALWPKAARFTRRNCNTDRRNPQYRSCPRHHHCRRRHLCELFATNNSKMRKPTLERCFETVPGHFSLRGLKQMLLAGSSEKARVPQ